jgi:hypothetical protein
MQSRSARAADLIEFVQRLAERSDRALILINRFRFSARRRLAMQFRRCPHMLIVF